MTTVIMARTSEFSIVMSDTREGKTDKNDPNYPYEDGIQKLYSIPRLGFITGAGDGEFLNKVKENVIKKRYIKNIIEITNIFEETANNEKTMYPSYAEEIDSSYIVYSWRGANTDGSDLFGINIISESYRDLYDGTNMRGIQENELAIIYPSDLVNKKEEINNFVERVQNLDVKALPFNRLIFEMLKLFRDISALSEESSSECEIGVLYLSKLDQLYYKQGTREDVNKLIDVAHKNKILKKFHDVD
ncbi:hypothetical protein ABD68_12420 [Bacillus endophyticus]|uniref:hypothetical protein n=1 Tax=Priestia endophytica TaxID=135735 RepID=UPI0018CD6A46|nr:hypothetical protein [Priestia endophytica]MBG9812370.1 hypothetical protein [Priestia endophytica]